MSTAIFDLTCLVVIIGSALSGIFDLCAVDRGMVHKGIPSVGKVIVIASQLKD